MKRKRPYGWKRNPPNIGDIVEFERDVLALEPPDALIRVGDKGKITRIWTEAEWVDVLTDDGTGYVGNIKWLKIIQQ